MQLSIGKDTTPRYSKQTQSQLLIQLSTHQTLCFQTRSAFFTKALALALPPAQPPATHKMASNFSSPAAASTAVSTWGTGGNNDRAEGIALVQGFRDSKIELHGFMVDEGPKIFIGASSYEADVSPISLPASTFEQSLMGWMVQVRGPSLNLLRRSIQFMHSLNIYMQ